jgi:hypothetical protein
MGTCTALKIAGGHGAQVANVMTGISKLPFFIFFKFKKKNFEGAIL